MKADVLIVGPIYPAAMTTLERDFNAHKLWLAPNREALLNAIGARIRGIATPGRAGASRALIESLPKLEIISCFAVGYEAVDLQAARERGIIVTNTPEVLNDCVADLALGLLIMSARALGASERFLRAGKWQQGQFPLAAKVSGKRCGIVGLGRIGRAIARRAEAFNMEIAYYGPRPKDVRYSYYDDLIALARDCDFLVVCAPGGPQTRHLVNAAVLEALGPDGFLVNVARGSLVDEEALIEALRDRRLGGAGLDVYEDEPNVPEALLTLENVVLLPHVGSATHETRAAMGELTVANLRAHFAGQPVLTPVPLK